MGEVYRARDPQLGRHVALKVLAASASKPDRRVRLEREARLLAAVNHEGIATVHELVEVDGCPVLVMELIEGETLATMLHRGRMTVRQGLEAALQIATALEAAHAMGILHRDLKPSNIAIAARGRVKLLDFGVGKLLDERAELHSREEPRSMCPDAATGTGGVVGRAAYMSPERARGESVDRLTDIWAFGCVLFEILSGRRAFGTPPTNWSAAVSRAEPDWRALPAGTP